MYLNKSMGKVYSFSLPSKILFGEGVSEKVGSEAKALGVNKILLVTDRNLRKMGITKKPEEALTREGFDLEVFSDVEAEPCLGMAEATAEAGRKRDYDLIVGIGGGSVLDMAKVASIATANPESMRHYVGVDKVKNAGLPRILLPTTAGTGSEVTKVAIMTIAENKKKMAIISPYMLGNIAMVDPRLTYTLPQRVTASTGLDALSHALEAIMSVNSNPLTDTLAYQSVSLIFSHLVNAYRTRDAESRYGMSLGSLVAGMSFGNSGVCLGHAAAYTFAPKFGVTHGISCGLVLPYVFRFNALAISWKLPKIAESMGIDSKGLGTKKMADSISDSIFELMAKVQLPRRLRDLDIPHGAVPEMAEKLLSIRRLIQRNPKPVTKRKALRLIEEMW
jgi:alcohol dehydrogenase class IV